MAKQTVYVGRFVRTHLDPAHPAARPEAVLVEGGRIAAIGNADDFIGVKHVALDGWIIPGLIEPHGHAGQTAIQLSDACVDIRPVVVETAGEVWQKITDALAQRPSYVVANGWDPLLQPGLVIPTIAQLDELAGDIPLIIINNSGHSLYFNTAAARKAGVDKHTPDPVGGSYEHDANGELTGAAFEAAAVEHMTEWFEKDQILRFPALFAHYLQSMRAVGYTTVSDLTWKPEWNLVPQGLDAARQLSTRLRVYEMTAPGGSPSVGFFNGDEMFRQVGAKLWADGSPWIGNIEASVPYLDNATTRGMGLTPPFMSAGNYTTQQIAEIGDVYAKAGFQLACHAHGDVAIDQVLDAYETIIGRHKLDDHRFRLEHAGLMTPAQFRRAAAIGVTVSLFVDHITYWGEVLVDELFGEAGAAWANAGAAFEAGIQATFHNDGSVTPAEPLRNMAVAETRTSKRGRHLDGGLPVTRADALRAHTSNAAWQLRSEHEIGALKPGLCADFTVLDVDPIAASADALASANVIATALAGEVEAH